MNKSNEKDEVVQRYVDLLTNAGFKAVFGDRKNKEVVMSILNTGFHTSGKIRGDEHFGSITWNGHSPHRVQMTELTKYSEFEIGDEVIASGLSHYFPEGVRIGYVESRTENENHTSLDVELRLAADMTRLSNVVLIENNNIVEITSLEELSKKE